MEDPAWFLQEFSREHPEKHGFCFVVISTREVVYYEPVRLILRLDFCCWWWKGLHVEPGKFYCYWNVLTLLMLESWLHFLWNVVENERVESVKKFDQLCWKLTNSYQVLPWKIIKRLCTSTRRLSSMIWRVYYLWCTNAAYSLNKSPDMVPF